MNRACLPAEPAWPARVATRYERLRGQAERGVGTRDRDGLTVLAHQGVAAWLDVLAALPVAPAGPDLRCPQEALSMEVETHAVDILLAMIRPHVAGRPV